MSGVAVGRPRVRAHANIPTSVPILLATMLGCNQAPPAPTVSELTEVVAATPIPREITDYEEFTGHTDAFRSVQIQARVSGYLVKRGFEDGANVKKDDVLYEIDDRPYAIALKSAEASVAQSQAHRTRLEADNRRASALFAKAAIGRQEFDLISSDFAESEAKLDAAKAQLENARLNMSFTKVRAPMDGQLSRTLVDPGNLIRQNFTILNDIVSTTKLYAYFDLSVDEMDRVSRVIEQGLVGGRNKNEVLVYVGTTIDADRYEEGKRKVRSIVDDIKRLELRRKQAIDSCKADLGKLVADVGREIKAIEDDSRLNKGKNDELVATTKAKLTTDEAARNRSFKAVLDELDGALKVKRSSLAEADRSVHPEFPFKGIVDFAENKLDSATGTLRVRGEVENGEAQTSLIPGLFIRVHLPIGAVHQALLVPEDSVGSDQGRTYLYVINSKNEVEYRPVNLGAIFEGEAGTKLRAVLNGLKADERFIQDSDTIRRLRPGARVKVDQPETRVAQALTGRAS